MVLITLNKVRILIIVFLIIPVELSCMQFGPAKTPTQEKEKKDALAAFVAVWIEYDEDLDQPIGDYGSPLYAAAESDTHVSITKRLLKHHANPNLQYHGDALIRAIMNNAPKTVKVLLRAGARSHLSWQGPNYLSIFASPRAGTILHYVCAMASKVVDNGLDVRAYFKNLARVARQLLLHGANPNCPNDAGETPLFLLCTAPQRATPIIVYLLTFGADLALKNNRDKNILEYLEQIRQQLPDRCLDGGNFIKAWAENKVYLKRKKFAEAQNKN